MLVGAISSAGIPGFAGFFSKDSIIEAAKLSQIPGSGFAYFCVLVCVFVTALYTFRMLFMAFFGEERFRSQGSEHGHDAAAHAPHESPGVVTVPLILLAIPSVCAGWLIGPVLFGGYFGEAIVVRPEHDVLTALGREFHGVPGMMWHALSTAPFWLAAGGIAVAVYLYLVRPELTDVLKRRLGVLYTILDRKYWFDELYSWLFAGGARLVGTGLWKGGDVAVIDGVVNGSARLVAWFAGVIRRVQSGFIYHYAFTMIIGIVVLLSLIFAAHIARVLSA
jgi:NADH-quinone oxidoreductase subunit L